MHIGPGTDADGVYAWVLKQFLPIIIDSGDVELVGHRLTRCPAAVGDGSDFQAFDFLETRDVPVTRVLTGADEADSDSLRSHCCPP